LPLPPATISYDAWSLGVVILELLLGTPDVFQPSPKAEARRRAAAERSRRASAREVPAPAAQPRASDSWRGKSFAAGSGGLSGGERRLGRAWAGEGSSEAGAGSYAEELAAPETAREAAAAEARLRLSAALAEYCIQPGAAPPDSPRGAATGQPANPLPLPPHPAAEAAAPSAPCGKAEFVSAVERLDPLRKRGVPLDAAMLDLAYRLLRWEPAERLEAAEALQHPALAGIEGALDAEYGHRLGEAEAIGARRATGNGGGLVPRDAASGGCSATSPGRDCTNEVGVASMFAAGSMPARVDASEHAIGAVVVAETPANAAAHGRPGDAN